MAFSRGDVVAGAFEVERSLETDEAFDACRARHLMTGKRITLKVLKRSVDWCEATIGRAKGLESIADDSLAACVHQGPAGRGRWCFAFEGLSRDEPDDKLPRKATAAMTSRIGASIASALWALHEEGLTHGHVRPERIVVTSHETMALKLLDFVMPPERALITSHARYVAPEIISGGAPSPEGDVYALGVILWELLAARALTASESRIGVLLGTLFDAPDPPFCDDPSFGSWVARMLAPEPLERPEARQVEAALRAFADGQSPAALSAPSTREQVDGRTGAASAILVVRPPPGKASESIGLDETWRRDVAAHGAQLSNMPDGAIVGWIRGNSAHGVATSASLVARATQEQAFRASVVAGLLRDGIESDGLARQREEIAAIAAIVSRTPAGVTRLTARLAAHVGPSVALRPSGDSFMLVSPAPAQRPKRSGTLEIETSEPKPVGSPRKRKTGEIDIGGSKPRGKSGTLVIEPEEQARPAKDKRSTGREAAVAPREEPSEEAGSSDEPRRGRGGTLVMEPEAPPRNVPAAEKATIHSEATRVAPLPEKPQRDAGFQHEDTPTLEIEVSGELVELSRPVDVEGRAKTTRGVAVKR